MLMRAISGLTTSVSICRGTHHSTSLTATTLRFLSEIWNAGTHFAVLAKRKMKRRFFYKYPHTMITRFLINSNDMSPAWTLVVQMNAFTGMEVIDNVNLQTLTQSIVPDVPSGTDLNYNNLTSKTSQSWL